MRPTELRRAWFWSSSSNVQLVLAGVPEDACAVNASKIPHDEKRFNRSLESLYLKIDLPSSDPPINRPPVSANIATLMPV
jgi:hypothetical protein